MFVLSTKLIILLSFQRSFQPVLADCKYNISCTLFKVNIFFNFLTLFLFLLFYVNHIRFFSVFSHILLVFCTSLKCQNNIPLFALNVNGFFTFFIFFLHFSLCVNLPWFTQPCNLNAFYQFVISIIITYVYYSLLL